MKQTLYLPRPWIVRHGPEKVFSHRGSVYVKRTVNGKRLAYWHRAVSIKLPVANIRLNGQANLITPM